MTYLQVCSYNLDVAKVFGVCSAVFLSCLDNEYKYQKRVKIINDNETVALARSEIYERTGLDDEKQIDVEIALNECGIIDVAPVKNIPNKNYYILHEDQLLNIMTAKDPNDVINDRIARQFIQQPRVEPVSKRRTRISALKGKISVEDEIIKQYMCDWIDAVYANPKGFLSPKGVELAQQELQAYSKGSQDIMVDLLKIAIKGGYRDITWAIEHYEKSHKPNMLNFNSYNDIKSNGADLIDEAF